MDLSRIGKSLGGIDRAALGTRPQVSRGTNGNGDPDRVELSGEATEVLSGYEGVRALASAVPPVREERVLEVRTRIAEGHYDAPSVRETVASRLAEAFLGLAPRPA